MPKKIVSPKIACLDMNLMKSRMHLGVHVVIDDPEKLEGIRQREADITLERVRKILAAGANVILTTKGIDDMCLKTLMEAGCAGVRRCKKEDLKRIAKATGGMTYRQGELILHSYYDIHFGQSGRRRNF